MVQLPANGRHSLEQVDYPPYNTDVLARYRINLGIKDEKRLNDHLEEQYSILLGYTYPVVVDRTNPLTLPTPRPLLPPNPVCMNYGKIAGVLIIPNNLKIPKPKEAITESVDSLRKLIPHLCVTAK